MVHTVTQMVQKQKLYLTVLLWLLMTKLVLVFNMLNLSGAGITVDEEITSFSAGYNLGGATIGLQYHEAENVDGTSGSDGEAIELRVKQSF